MFNKKLSLIKKMKQLKWGLAKIGSKFYGTLKDALQILERGDFEKMNPVEILGGIVFKGYHDTELIVPEHLSRPTRYDVGTLNNQKVSHIQRTVGIGLENKRHMIHSKFEHPELIYRDLVRLVNEASKCTSDIVPNASQPLSSMYDLREHNKNKFFLAIGNCVNSMTSPDNYAKTYAQQAKILEDIVRAKIPQPKN